MSSLPSPASIPSSSPPVNPDKPQILLLGSVDFAHEALSSLSPIADILTPQSHDRASFLTECRSGAFDRVRAIYRTFFSSRLTGPFDQTIIGALPSNVLFLAHCGAGYDAIDVGACAARDPPLHVSNVVDPVIECTADAAIFLILGATRNFNTGLMNLRKGDWMLSDQKMGFGVEGKTLGVLGMGGIGRRVAEKCATAFGMKIIYHNRRPLSDAIGRKLAGADGEADDRGAAGNKIKSEASRKFQAEYVSFEELLAQSDVLSLNLPLNAKTRHIISAAEIALMKPGVVIINTARGAIIHEQALVDALRSGHIRSVGLDVYEHEPAVHPDLLANENVMLLPHLGTWTVDASCQMEEWALENLRWALTVGRLKSPVPEHAHL